MDFHIFLYLYILEGNVTKYMYHGNMMGRSIGYIIYIINEHSENYWYIMI